MKLLAAFFILAVATIASANEDICQRTPEVRQAIEEALGMGCAEIHMDQLKLVTADLVLKEKGLKTLQQDDFHGLVSLEKLDLSFNELSVLPENIFKGLTSLKNINLSHNQLSALPENIFQVGFTNFMAINLGHNQLTELPEGLFKGLSKVTWLTLSFNKLSHLPEKIFH